MVVKGFYRNPYPAVKPDYSFFSDLLKKVINRFYPIEFISDNIRFDLTAIKLTVIHQKIIL